MVWDSLHNMPLSTPLNDVDVIYYQPNESNLTAYLTYETQLKEQMPTLNWQVRNQATMHKRNGDLPYTSSLDAMRYWPEKETAIAIRQVASNRYECIAAFGFESLFNGCITHNPKRSRETFEDRISNKNWLIQWPSLQVLPTNHLPKSSIKPMKKIAIIGSGGSGKSTFSVLLGQELNLPVHHLDKLYWKPNWTKTPNIQWTDTLTELCKNERWIIDGNYKSTLGIRLAACDTVIFLDVNRFTCICRAIKRTLKGKTRPDMAEGCKERLNMEFIKFLWDFPTKTRPIIMKKLNSAIDSKNVIIAKSGKHAFQLCKALNREDS